MALSAPPQTLRPPCLHHRAKRRPQPRLPRDWNLTAALTRRAEATEAGSWPAHADAAAFSRPAPERAQPVQHAGRQPARRATCSLAALCPPCAPSADKRSDAAGAAWARSCRPRHALPANAAARRSCSCSGRRQMLGSWLASPRRRRSMRPRRAPCSWKWRLSGWPAAMAMKNAQCLRVREIRYGDNGAKHPRGAMVGSYDEVQGYTHEPRHKSNVLRINRFQAPEPAGRRIGLCLHAGHGRVRAHEVGASNYAVNGCSAYIASACSYFFDSFSGL